MSEQSRPAGAAAENIETRCPGFRAAIELVGKRWNGAIILAAAQGVRRYSEFLAAVPGISDRVLAQRLRELESAKVIVRDVIATRPVQITYKLSERGKDLARAVEPLIVWGERWLTEGQGTK